MHYLTNYYKNLSEQLQERVNNLTQLIDQKENYFNPYKTESERLGTEWEPKSWPITNNIKVPDSLFKEKTKSPYLNKYGDPDAIDIIPKQRRDMMS
jgi:hypothetical protein